jgi:hypothetical protein
VADAAEPLANSNLAISGGAQHNEKPLISRKRDVSASLDMTKRPSGMNSFVSLAQPLLWDG